MYFIKYNSLTALKMKFKFKLLFTNTNESKTHICISMQFN